MFQNDRIAKDHGDKVFKQAKARGAKSVDAATQADRAQAKKLKELDDWTRKNVGLN